VKNASDETGALTHPEAHPEAAAQALPPGAALGPYEVVALLGAGGMGEVYRARDPRLGREVAIKVIRGAEPSREALLRFDQEARAAGALNHPNLLVVYDVGAQDGVPFVVTELLEGETLRDRLRRGPLPAAEAIALLRQALAGLDAAHRKGIVHRDLKPENLFLTADGRVKILDFGLAKRLDAPRSGDESLTRAGMMLGTVGYTAPEQLSGQPALPASDLFALGAVLYEMVSGRRAFAGGTPLETLGRVLTADPPPLAAAGAQASLARIVARCLAKQPAARYGSVAALLVDLDALGSPAAGDESSSAATGVLPSATRSVAVLPFRDLAGEAASAYLRLGLADATITELARHRGLVVRPTSAVLRYQEGAVDAGAAARELGVDTLVEGTYLRAGGRLRVSLQLIRVADRVSTWGTKVEGDAEDLFALQDEVARQVAVALLPSPAGAAEPSPRAAPAGEAYDLYLQGRARLVRESLADYVAAINLFERARDADPSFALAWAGLADGYARMTFNFQPEGDWHQRAQAACEQALRLDPALPEGRYARGRLRWTPQQGWDHAGAIRDLHAAVTAVPGFADAHQRLGTVLYHVGLVDEGERHLEQTLAIDPGHLSGLGQLAFCRCHRGSFAAALAPSLEVAHTLAPWDLYQLALCQLRLGQNREAAASAARIEEAQARQPLAASIRGVLAAGRGDFAAAREEARQVVAERAAWGHYHHAQYDLACIHALLGERDDAVDQLEAAAVNGYPCAPFFALDPLLASLRGEPRFATLLARLAAQRAGYARLYAELQAATGPPRT
jgi:eukaryotic-like serine/threonine-protein kinase